MPRKICVAFGCEDLAEAGLAHCRIHEEARQAKLAEQKDHLRLRPQAQANRRLYSSAAWQRAAKGFLAKHPLCVHCAELGLVVPAAEVDHIAPHLGDRAKFWARANWQPLCKPCHSRKTAGEVWGDGGRIWGWSIPHGLRPSAVPVTVIAGPPGAGKSTLIQARAAAEDLVIDMDAFMQQVGGRKWDQDRRRLRQAFKLRDQALHGLATRRHGQAWLPVIAADPAERAAWLAALGPKASLEVLAPPRSTVSARLMADPARQGRQLEMLRVMDEWFRLNPS